MSKKKAALFLCRCGTNIANFVDLEKVQSWAEDYEGVEILESHNLLCAPDGKEFFKKTLEGKNVDAVVIAACSPKMHEKTFQDLGEEVGLNMSQVQLANIREQCGWVTKDKEEATDKAKGLITASLKRTMFSEVLEKRSMEVNSDLLVIGGGIAGMEAALTAAMADRKVYILERDISLGGEIIKSEEVAPNMECSPCLLAPRLSDIKDHPNIEVISNAEVTGAKGFYGNFTVSIRKKPRYIKDNCIGCEACFDVCPVNVKSDFHLGLGTHKAVYIQFPGSVPAAAAIVKDACKHYSDGSCKDACVAECPFESFDFDQKEESLEINVGAVILATGLDNADPALVKDLGYGQIDEVYSLPEFERLAASNGPYGGEIKTRSGAMPKSVAVIHCASSMRDDGVSYCSGVCCTQATKVGALIRINNPEVKVHNVYHDLVFSGHREWNFYNEQKEKGTSFIKCEDLKKVHVASKDGGIQVEGPGFNSLQVDMVVLATGYVPREDSGNIAELFNIERDKNGFFKSDHDLLHSTGSALDGLYLAGSVGGPADVGSVVARSHAAVGDAISKLVPGRKIDLEILTSEIDGEKCAGCKMCISVCPYKAVNFDAEKSVCVINEVICRGCGTCTASCPSGASKAKNYTDEQIYAEIKGVL